MDPEVEAALAETASEWFVRMRGPDAGRLRPTFEAWLAEHPNHRIMYDRIALRWDQAGLVGHTPSGQAREGVPPKSARRPVTVWRYAIAAGIALVLGFGVVLLQRGGPPASQEVAIAAIASDIGIRRVRLADGSVVTLDADTRLQLRFTDKERRLALTGGRARFEVAHDAARPFIVEADGREVVATGTIFDVSLRDGKVAVVLLRGGVDVRSAPASREALLARLAPGQAVELAPGSGKPAVGRAAAEALEWPSGMFEFDGTPLREVLAVANRYSARAIVLGDPALASLQVTGGFRMGDPDKLAATLAATFGLRVERSADGRLLLFGK
jgi:transmembrane sensor